MSRKDRLDKAAERGDRDDYDMTGNVRRKRQNPSPGDRVGG
ncbi:hypothetical protein [Sphingosinicella sp. CPCC 101087]|nr:hypothetical protein [Sphingosinicella sp. CPCC 101087]